MWDDDDDARFRGGAEERWCIRLWSFVEGHYFFKIFSGMRR